MVKKGKPKKKVDLHKNITITITEIQRQQVENLLLGSNVKGEHAEQVVKLLERFKK